MKTIKQIADELGVSKQAVHQKRKKEPLSTNLQPFTEIIDGVVYISKDGEKLIKQTFSKIGSSKDSDIYVNKFTTVDDFSENFSVVIEVLQKQLEIKDKQIADQQKNINELTASLEHVTNSLKAAQALHAGTMQQHFENLPTISEQQEDQTEEPERKERFINRFFRKKKR